MINAVRIFTFGAILLSLSGCVVPETGSDAMRETAVGTEATEVAEVATPTTDPVLSRLSAELGRPASFKTTTRTSDQGYTYICGRPTELDGSEFDFSTAKAEIRTWIADGTFENRFCALSKNGQIVEFDIGSTDMEVFDWIEAYQLDVDKIIR